MNVTVAKERPTKFNCPPYGWFVWVDGWTTRWFLHWHEAIKHAVMKWEITK